MRLRLLSIFFTTAAVVYAIGLSSVAAHEKVTSLRILSFNIHHVEGTDGKIDLPRQAKVIQDSNADLVCLQEVDDRTGRVDQTARLAELTGFHGEFVHQLDFSGGRYGQAVLSRYPISEAECIAGTLVLCRQCFRSTTSYLSDSQAGTTARLYSDRCVQRRDSQQRALD